MSDRIAELMDRRDDVQSQLDALCGENPEEELLLVKERAALERLIAEGE